MSPSLQVGAQLPNLLLTSSNGQPAILSELLCGRPAVLYFLRTASCPVCRAHLKTLVRRLPELAAQSVRVFAIVPDGVQAARALSSSVGYALPVLTGGKSGHVEAGLEPALFGRVLSSGTVLLDGERRVRYARQAALPPLSFNERELLVAIEQLESRAA